MQKETVYIIFKETAYVPQMSVKCFSFKKNYINRRTTRRTKLKQKNLWGGEQNHTIKYIHLTRSTATIKVMHYKNTYKSKEKI